MRAFQGETGFSSKGTYGTQTEKLTPLQIAAQQHSDQAWDRIEQREANFKQFKEANKTAPLKRIAPEEREGRIIEYLETQNKPVAKSYIAGVFEVTPESLSAAIRRLIDRGEIDVFKKFKKDGSLANIFYIALKGKTIAIGTFEKVDV